MLGPGVEDPVPEVGDGLDHLLDGLCKALPL